MTFRDVYDRFIFVLTVHAGVGTGKRGSPSLAVKPIHKRNLGGKNKGPLIK